MPLVYRSQAHWMHDRLVRQAQQAMRNAQTNPFSDDYIPKKSKKKSMDKIIHKNKDTPTDEQLAQELNPVGDNGYRYKFRTKNGAVNYTTDTLPGCCGVGEIGGVAFGTLRGDHTAFYEEFKQHLIDSNSLELNRGNILLSDAVGGEHKQVEQGRPCVYSMCKHLKLKEFELYNPRTGHNLILFALEKEVQGNCNQYPRVDEQNKYTRK